MSAPGQNQNNTATQGGAKGKGKRIITLKISLATLISSCFALLLGIIWVFILGVIIGRGQMSQDSTEKTTGEKVSGTSTASSFSAAGSDKPGDTTGTASSDPQLGTENLMYRNDLRRADPTRNTTRVPVPVPATATPALQPTAQATTQTGQTATAPVQSAPAAGTNQLTQTPAVTVSGTNGKDNFDYVYQVASFKEQQQAEKMIEKLKKSGITSNIEVAKLPDGSTAYRVLAPFRGTQEGTEILKSALATQGVQKPIIRSKTPVPALR